MRAAPAGIPPAGFSGLCCGFVDIFLCRLKAQRFPFGAFAQFDAACAMRRYSSADRRIVQACAACFSAFHQRHAPVLALAAMYRAFLRFTS